MTVRLKICYLYPELLNLYGDRGNVLVLARRISWRGMSAGVEQVSLGDSLNPKAYDLIFFGGGPDQAQSVVAADLPRLAPFLIEAALSGRVILSICGGYQLLGKFYRDRSGVEMPGLGLFNAYTEAGTGRLRGNIAISIPALPVSTPVVGFENHSGITFLLGDDQDRDQGQTTRELGRVLYGRGNNGIDATEGARLLNTFGTYLHGPLLAKNPHFADYLLSLALERQLGEPVVLAPLDDSLEMAANHAVFGRFRRASGDS